MFSTYESANQFSTLIIMLYEISNALFCIFHTTYDKFSRTNENEIFFYTYARKDETHRVCLKHKNAHTGEVRGSFVSS